ncbi:hypothetical protein GCM10027296_23390 [Chitinimonas naiadis]
MEYELENFGIEMGQALRPVCDWGTQNMDVIASIASVRAKLGSEAPGMAHREPLET